jgi:hypothetical protein
MTEPVTDKERYESLLVVEWLLLADTVEKVFLG